MTRLSNVALAWVPVLAYTPKFQVPFSDPTVADPEAITTPSIESEKVCDVRSNTTLQMFVVGGVGSNGIASP